MLIEGIQTNENPLAGSSPGVIRGGSATGDLRIHEFKSRIFRNTRFIRVWLPPGYDEASGQGRGYPVLYLNDGQNLFEPATSFTGVEWQVDETADRLIREGVIAPMIVVGIDNGYGAACAALRSLGVGLLAATPQPVAGSRVSA